MKSLSRILFPAAVMAVAATAAFEPGREAVSSHVWSVPAVTQVNDTIEYPHDGWKLRRTAGLEEIMEMFQPDTLMAEDDTIAGNDTIPRISARDTLKAPDSLRFTDPFRYKYYVALNDSLTHVQTRDSLKAASRSKFAIGDSINAKLDSLDWTKLDSIYVADSTAFAKAEFEAWYNSLDKRARKKYDAEQLLPIKLAEMDSIKKAKEDKQAVKDSIIENTPRILETYAVPDSLQYKRIIAWTTDQDFHKMDIYVPDTTYHHHFFDDYPYQRNDVNASSLGVNGSPLQYYNFFNRKSDEGVDFYDALEAWSYSPRTLPHYNSKTPYTELAYFGTLFAKKEKESDNLHLFTTQNITPAFNFSLLYNRFGGGGILANEETINKTTVVQTNYLGKKYTMHAGYIHNLVKRGENGGITDNYWVRDTTIEFREVPVYFPSNASSRTDKKTVFLDQQLRIPFTFINKMKAKKDSTFVFDADSLDRDITTAFIGHSTEFSVYKRSYEDKVTSLAGMDFYNNIFRFDPTSSLDTLKMSKLDNKFFIRLQPWSEDGVISKLDLGVGDYIKTYRDTTYYAPENHTENSAYVYAGAEGQIKNYINWNAKAHYVFLGHDFADFDVEANAKLSVYPFRRARKSPASLSAHFETSLKEPNYYQQNMSTNHFKWENDFGKISSTKIQGGIDIPRWKLNASVGYALLANNVYYDTLGIIRQNKDAMSVLSASLRKEFVLGPVHLDNKILFQYSSNEKVMPLPPLSFNMRYYLQFVVQRDESKTHNIMEMQLGVNAWYNTPWYAPAYNPNIGVFHNQNKTKYTNGPYFDVFANVQWKRAVIFIKYQNAGKGWPLKHRDFFSSDGYIVGQNGMDGFRLGVYWPFYTQTSKHSHSSTTSSSGSSGSSGGRSSTAGLRRQ